MFGGLLCFGNPVRHLTSFRLREVASDGVAELNSPILIAISFTLGDMFEPTPRTGAGKVVGVRNKVLVVRVTIGVELDEVVPYSLSFRDLRGYMEVLERTP